MTVKDAALQSTSWKPFWKAFPVLALVPIGALAAYTSSEINGAQRELRRTEHFAVELEFEAVNRGLNQVATDVCTLARQNELASYLETGEHLWLDSMEQEYLHLAANAELYDQIRFLDEDGIEIVRVNYIDGMPETVGPEDLQDKSDRYYISESLALQPGEVYVSPLDLNVEHGAVEIPYRPMIRVGTPVADASGQVRGIVLINFRAQTMLDRVVASGTVSTGDPIMLNQDGYWLVSPEPPPSWGFMFPDHVEMRMPSIDPVAWDYLTDNMQGEVVTERGLLTFRSYHPLAEIGNCPGHNHGMSGADRALDYRWILASYLPADAWAQIERRAILASTAVGGTLLLLLAIGTRALTILAEQRRRHRARLEMLARFDSLTDLANRATFEEHLALEQGRAQRYSRRFAVLYLDLDGFKAVNDCLGHEAGDQVLIDVARILKTSSRSVDTPARIGGDEFALLLSEVDSVAAAHKVAQRICDRIAALSHDQRIIGVSIGIAVWPDHCEDASQIVRLADEAMYAAKAAGTNRIHAAETP